MIKGDGYFKNYISLNEDLKHISGKHHSIRPYVKRLVPIHLSYKHRYRNCPLRKHTSLMYLETAYLNSRETLLEYYYDQRSSNYCCYCGRNEPDELDHFHPSSLTPQYSILRFNLIRSCGKCNKSKLAKRPVSSLKLKHPYFDNSYNTLEILFEVKISSVFRNSEGDVIFDVDVFPQRKLSENKRRDIKNALRIMGIQHRVGDRIALELGNIYAVDWKKRGNVKARKKRYRELSDSEKKKKHYTEYFCYKLLASLPMIRKLDAI